MQKHNLTINSIESIMKENNEECDKTIALFNFRQELVDNGMFIKDIEYWIKGIQKKTYLTDSKLRGYHNCQLGGLNGKRIQSNSNND